MPLHRTGYYVALLFRIESRQSDQYNPGHHAKQRAGKSRAAMFPTFRHVFFPTSTVDKIAPAGVFSSS